MKEIKKQCRITQKHKANITFIHLESLVDLLINRLLKKEIDISNTEIFKYLVQTETWSRYELVLFNNTLFYFSPDAVDQILPRAVDKLIRYQVIDPYTNEAVILLANAIVFFIKENDFERAIQYIDVAARLFLTEEQVYERLLVKCLHSMRKILFKDKTGFEEMENLFSIMEFFKMDSIAKMFNNLVYDLKCDML